MKRNIKKLSAFFLSTVAALALTACSSDSTTGSTHEDNAFVNGRLTDSRDGKTYKTVKIGEKVWMAENLNYQTSDSKCYESKQENCDKYGRLYIWREAVTACPDGWRLPSKEDFEQLRTIAGQKAGDKDKAGIVLKSWTGWEDYKGKSGNGTDVLGFAGLPAGYYDSYYDYFNREGNHAYFWSSTEYDKDVAYYLDLYYGIELAYMDYYDKYYAFSVRCIKD